MLNIHTINFYFTNLKPTVLTIISAIKKIFRGDKFSWKMKCPIRATQTIPTAPQIA